MDDELTKEQKNAKLLADAEKVYIAVRKELERQWKIEEREKKLKEMFGTGE